GTPFSARTLLLCEQSRDVAQCYFRTVLVVAVFSDESLLHDRDLLPCFLIGPRSRSDEPQNVAALIEQILLDGLAHARVAHQLELLAGLESHHRLADDLLAEREFAGIGHLDLLLHRTQEPLVRGPRLP